MPQQQEILAIVRLSVCDQWPVRHAADVKSNRWRPRSHTNGVDHPRVRARGCGPCHTPGWAATEQLHWRSQLVRTAALRLDRSSPKRVPGNLFPGN